MLLLRGGPLAPRAASRQAAAAPLGSVRSPFGCRARRGLAGDRPRRRPPAPGDRPLLLRQQRRQHRAGAVVALAAAGPEPEGEWEEGFDDDEDEEEDAGFEQEADAALLDEDSVRARRQMSAEAGPSGAPPAGLLQLRGAAGAGDGGQLPQPEGGEVEEQEPPFPEPEDRAMALCDLFGFAAEVEAAQMLQERFPDAFCTGLCDDAALVLPGDLYCCVERAGLIGISDGAEDGQLRRALAAGAAAIVAPRGADLSGADVPAGMPVVYADDVDEIAARLAAAFHDVPSRSLNVVSVTGTSGKTTVAWLVRGVLEQAGELTGMVGSVEHALAEHLLSPDGRLWQPSDADPAAGRECASPFTLVPYRGRYSAEETTPSGMCVQKLLAAMRDRGGTAAVVECSPAGIASGSVELLESNVAVFTNLGEDPEDLALFGSKEECLDAMLELFRGLTDASKQRAVVNADDPVAQAVLAACPNVPAITYGLDSPKADVRCESLELNLWQTTMIVATPVGRLEIISNLVGRHNAPHILAAVAVGVLLNLPLADIGAGIESVQVVPGRCEVVNNPLDLGGEEAEQQQQQPGAEPQQTVRLPTDFPVVVDAADSPERLAAVLESLREAGAARVFTVFGCDGQTTSGETRARMGEVAHQRSEFVILTNSSPRLEPPEDIIKDVVSGWPNEMFEPYAAYVYGVFQDQTRAPLWFEPFLHSAQRRWHRHIMEDRFQAIRAAIGTAGPGDAVLIAGRGHLDFVEHWDGGRGLARGWFDDRVEARNALSKLQYLYALVNLDRSALPWGPPPDEARTVVIELDK